ncbi:MAG: protein kinase [Gemmataceae bacterium]
MDTRNTTTTPARDSSPNQPTAAPVLDGYEILEEVARGGMGVVYKARQVNLGRVVAIKTILGNWAGNTEMVQRFRAEAETIARLEHPNLVAIHQVGDWQGVPYLVMEYVGGGTLDPARRDYTPREAAQLIQTLARVLHTVHQRGIVHRDLKPGNILLTEDGLPKVSDFGLARQLEGGSGLTLSGDVLGTPEYMAPEQAEGRSGEAGPPTDIFSLGAMLYELLVGRPPFAGGSAWEVMERVRRHDPVSPRRLVAGIPRDLETITLKCLAKDPARRYQDARELADDLARFLADEPILARATPWWERAWMWSRRHPAVASLGLLSAVSVAALLIASLVYQTRLANALNVASAAVEESRQRLVQLSLTQGGQALEEENHFRALVWFLEAMRLDDEAGESDRLHRIRAGTILRTSPALRQVWFHDSPGRVAAVHTGGRRVLLGTNGGARIFDVASGQPVSRPLAPSSPVVAGLFAAGDLQVFVGCGDGSVHWHDAATGRTWALPGVQKDAPAHTGAITRLALSADGGTLLTAGADGFVRLWATDGPHSPRVSVQANGPALADLAADGTWFVTAGQDRTVRAFDGRTGKPLGPSVPHPQPVNAVRIAPNGRGMATGCGDGGVRMFDRTGKAVWGPVFHRQPVLAVEFNPASTRLVSASEDNTARLWDAATGQAVGGPLWHASDVEGAVFSADGRGVVTFSDDNTARVWNAATDEAVTSYLPHNGSVARAVFVGDGRHLLTASNDGTARLWDLLPPLTPSPAVPVPDGEPVDNAAGRWVSPDGKVELVRAGEYNARLRDVRTGAPLGGLLRHAAVVHAAAFAPAGDRVVTASDDNMTRCWDAATGAPHGRPILHRCTIRLLTISPDGRMLFTFGADRSMRVWDLDRAQPLTPLHYLPVPVDAAAFSADGERVTARLHDGAIRTWDLRPDPRPAAELSEHATLLLGRRLDEHGELLPLDLATFRQLWERRRSAGR